ncbi:MAG: ABC transporter ATP-binding protein [Clostridia bacterium]|nr:ABC transporter ATP-binding protein [Clostridia bacterium]
MSDSFVFSAKGLAVGYKGRALISDISFSLKRGSILTLIGPNGAGKSTILKTITRQLAAIAGTAFIDNDELKQIKNASLAKKLAVVLTDRIKPEMMSCFDVAAMGRYPHTGRFGTLTSHDKDVTRRALERVKALDIADRDFNLISDGQKQRILLARALCQEPEVLVLDEPTSFLDIRYKIDLLDILLEEARSRRLTVIMSLHEIDLAEKVSDYVMCVKGDHIERFGAPREVFDDETIAGLYGLTSGVYLTRRGSVELSKPEGESRVFVVGGNGHGIYHYRALQKRRIPFDAGILFENDMEYDVAKSLSRALFSVPAFEPMDEETYAKALEAMKRCGAVLDAGAPVGTLNAMNGRLLAEARRLGIKTVNDANEID